MVESQITITLPSVGLRIFSTALHLVGSSMLAFLFARRTMFEHLGTIKGWQQINFARLCLLLVFVDSWLFLTFTGVLIYGVGLGKDQTSCAVGVFSWILIYTSSKVFIYLFLTEKVLIVWSHSSTNATRARLHTPAYIICLANLSLYAACIVVLCLFRVSKVQKNHECIIGLGEVGSITLLIYDVFITLLLTSLFVYPLLKRNVGPELRRIVTRTLISSALALLTSTMNIAVLTIMHGQQIGWVSLASCSTDVTINALVLYMVTTTRNYPHATTPSSDPPHLNPGRSVTTDSPSVFVLEHITSASRSVGNIDSPNVSDDIAKRPTHYPPPLLRTRSLGIITEKDYGIKVTFPPASPGEFSPDSPDYPFNPMHSKSTSPWSPT